MKIYVKSSIDRSIEITDETLDKIAVAVDAQCEDLVQSIRDSGMLPKVDLRVETKLHDDENIPHIDLYLFSDGLGIETKTHFNVFSDESDAREFYDSQKWPPYPCYTAQSDGSLDTKDMQAVKDLFIHSLEAYEKSED